MTAIAQPEVSKMEQWFDHLVAQLRTDQALLELDMARPEVKRFYNVLMSGNEDAIAHENRLLVQQHFLKKIIVEYLLLLKNNLPLRLAFDYNDAEILVWAEMKDDDEEMERRLILTEAKVNAKYHRYGFDLRSTLEEKSDGLPIPAHYKNYKS